jgi:glyoxylase-like metal-dependent hydrolase (beta-lactamase superfamily II)
VVHTDYQQARQGGTAALLKLGAAFVCSRELDRLASAPGAPPDPAAPPLPARPNPRFVFDRQLHLFPGGIEVRISAIGGKARTAGDVFLYVPSEKVLVLGDYITPGSFPLIDSGPGEGTATGWIDGLRQVVDSVPLLKSAMPQPKPDPAAPPVPEKTLEELVFVIPGHGAPSDLKQLKDLLASAIRLRAEASRAVGAGRAREDFLRTLSGEAYKELGNVEPFAAALFDDLSRKHHAQAR